MTITTLKMNRNKKNNYKEDTDNSTKITMTIMTKDNDENINISNDDEVNNENMNDNGDNYKKTTDARK